VLVHRRKLTRDFIKANFKYSRVINKEFLMKGGVGVANESIKIKEKIRKFKNKLELK
jgi:hypothetical protein